MKFKCLFFSLMIFFGFLGFGFAQEVGQPLMVRLVYFLPSDRQPHPDIDAKMDKFIKDIQLFFADEMERHGFGRKTFMCETDATGQAVVHHVNGQFTEAYYGESGFISIWDEIKNGLDTSKDFYLAVVDVAANPWGIFCGYGSFLGAAAGQAVVSITDNPPDCFDLAVAAHELGHAFGLEHDFRSGTYLMNVAHSGDIKELSPCAAGWLDVHQLFNPHPQRQQIFDRLATIEMLPPRGVPPNAVRFSFKVTDADGLHQAQLVIPTILGFYPTQTVDSCKLLDGTTAIVEFDTTGLMPKSDVVVLSVIDKRGNPTWQRFSIDASPLLPPSKVVSIPDVHLAAAIRESLNLTPDDVFTTHVMLDLVQLYAQEHKITDLTGLEYATNLRELWLYNASDSINNNEISDLSPLRGLKRLQYLDVEQNLISDVSALSNLKQLEFLRLRGNFITDVSPLSGLTQLKHLLLGGNSVSDIFPLSNLTRLEFLSLDGNSITDISALDNLTRLKILWLSYNKVRDITPLANLENLNILYLSGNPIVDRTPVQTLLSRNPNLEVAIDGNPPAVDATDTSVREIGVESSITGPWLWMIAPTAPNRGGAASTNIDSLAAASSGAVTEADVAKNGANEGDTVGNLTWTLAEIRNTGTFFELSDNGTDVVHRIGWAKGDIDHHSSYALITLESTTAQEDVMMRVGSDDSIKVWLNGEVVHNNPIDRGSSDFQDFFRLACSKVIIFFW